MAIKMGNQNLVLLLLFTVTIHGQVEKQIPLVQPGDCDRTEFYDLNNLRCEPCPVNSVQNTQQPTKCTCQSGFKIKTDFGGQSLECVACGDNKVPTREGWDCLACASPSSVSSTSCASCENTDNILNYRLSFGLADTQQVREFRNCGQCRSGTQPSLIGDSQICAPCSRFSEEEVNCKCEASNNVKGIREGGVCFISDIDRSELNKIQTETVMHFGTGAEQVSSALLQQHLRAAYLLCRKRNHTACNLVANTCVLLHYSQNDVNNACNLYEQLQRLTDVQAPLPKLESDTVDLGRTDIPTQFTFDENEPSSINRLQLMAAVYDVYGNFLGLQNVTNGLLQLCPAETRILDKAYRFGQFYHQSCQIPLNQLWTKYQTRILDLHLQYSEGAQQRLYEVSVLDRNYTQGTLQPNALGADPKNWKLRRRLFLVDNVAGIDASSPSSAAKYVQYARSIELVITLQNGKRGRILPPYVIVDYDYVPSTALLTNRQVTLSFRVSYTGDEQMIRRHDKDLEIAMGVLCSLGLLWSLLRAWSWSKRAGKAIFDLWIVASFVLSLCGAVADVFLIVMWFTAAWICFAYKWQMSVAYMLLTAQQERGCLICVGVAFGLKLIQLLHSRSMQANTETFFIDWERPRGHVMPEGGEPEGHEPSIQDINLRPAAPITVWRTYMVANEWNELQNYRKTSLALQVVAVLFVLKVLHFEALAIAEPGVVLADYPSYASDTRLNRFAVGCGVYLLVGFIQWAINVLIVQRLLDDHFRNFMDLCSISNISVLALVQQQFGYYIHGRSVHGRADANMKEMNGMLQREQDNLTGQRGLEPSSDVQCFMVALPRAFREKLDFEKEPLRTSSASRDNNVDKNTARMNTIIQVHTAVNNFLLGFIEQRNTQATYRIADRSPIEALLDVEFEDASQNGIFFRDESDTAYTAAFLYGNEWVNLTFDALLFSVLDLLFTDYVLSACGTFVVATSISAITEMAFTSNLMKTSLVDDRFLI